ncbi:MAG: BatA domain-containing protein [Bacteroidia bacterium]|nr:BatA domain-containing protein [Bacteroidia bacterium]
MQFKHPEILYALLLLLIPIFIHLFQLRRFQKVDFTNVAFLKKVTIQTRKSSQLKKWLTLLMRLLALACVILAFAQPYSASKLVSNSQQETVIYIDNSFSMSAKGPNGPLLERAKQQLYDAAQGDDKINWFTNTESRKNSSVRDFKGDVLDLDHVHNQLSLQEVLLKAGQFFSKSENSDKRLVIVSDFQELGSFPEVPDNIMIDAVKLSPVVKSNVVIDTAFLASSNTSSSELKVQVSAQGEFPSSVPISLHDESLLIAKTAVDLSEGPRNTLSFDIEDPSGFKGALQITDGNLQFDNTLYFSINTPKQVKILSINEGDTNFLQRLFGQESYNYVQQAAASVNYNDIPNQHFVFLNELRSIPLSLTNSLKAFSDGGGGIGIILPKNADISSYNVLLNTLQLGSISSKEEQEKKITKINFSHPLFQNVFEKQVTNFQYPKVNSFYGINTNSTEVLEFEDGKPFLIQNGLHYLLCASISEENSNFKSSPLIVPSLINMAQQSLPLPRLYYYNGAYNSFAIPVKLAQDDIISIRDSVTRFIPLQQTKANSVLVTTTDEPRLSGNYSIVKDDNVLEYISYNYPRNESSMQYMNPEDWSEVKVYNSVAELFDEIASDNKVNSFWKWFVIFAVVFLLLEMLILKFYK